MKKLLNAMPVALICSILLFLLASCEMVSHMAGNSSNSANRPTPTPSSNTAHPSDESSTTDDAPPPAGPIDVFEFPMPVASGENVSSNEKAEIDYSNAEHGYVMVRFLADTDAQLRALVTNPDGQVYTHFVRIPGEFEVLPLTGGDGEYSIGVFEAVEDGRFARSLEHTINVTLVDEFAPFLRPNQNVNFNRDSAVVAVAAELVHGIGNFHERVRVIYEFVVTHIEYDFHLAATVQPGYIPDIDAVLASGLGICFDYSAVMVAMLRSIGIPTQLVIGYAGDVYHAWINVYSEEEGWIDALLFFDGNEWHYMDPTFTSAAGFDNEALRQFIGDGANYHAMRTY